MLMNDYLKLYLDFYEQANLLGIGTIYKIAIPVVKEEKTLYPPSYSYKLDELQSENIDHFVMFICQYEKRSFEEVKKEVISDFQYCNMLINENNSFQLEGIGNVRFFNNQMTLFEDPNPDKTFGNKPISLKYNT